MTEADEEGDNGPGAASADGSVRQIAGFRKMRFVAAFLSARSPPSAAAVRRRRLLSPVVIAGGLKVEALLQHTGTRNTGRWGSTRLLLHTKNRLQSVKRGNEPQR